MIQLISKYFKLEEFINSQIAIEKHIDNTPNDEIIENLNWLCLKILDPLRAKLNKSIVINSGYRSLALNLAVGGTQNPISQHTKGKAADIIVPGMIAKDLMNFIIDETSLPFDQLIFEFESWVHITYDKEKQIQREEKLMINHGTGYVPYIRR